MDALRDIYFDSLDWLSDHSVGFKRAVLFVLLVGLVLWWKAPSGAIQVGPDPDPQGYVLILLHGHGASKSDLEPLAVELSQAAPTMTFILPSAPHSLPIGYTWYPSFRAPTQALADAKTKEHRVEARQVVLEIVSELVDEGILTSHIYVGGFSQGASVALDVFLSESLGPKLAGIISLSGGALPLELESLGERAPARTFISHGNRDSVLSVSFSRKLAAMLEEGGHEVQFVESPDVHTVAPIAIYRLGQFLRAVHQ